MDPRRLLTFRTVAHERSFSRAAERLSRSQPSVSHQIALLETEIGTRLFERGRGGLRLTPAGKLLLEHADQVAWRLELADTQIADLTGEHRQHLRIGCVPTALAGFVPSAVRLLRDADHHIRILLSEITASTLEPRLLSGEFDVAVTYQDATIERREIHGVERIDLLRDTFLIGLPLEHRLAPTTAPIALRELVHDDWVVPSMSGFLIESCRDAGFEPNVVAVSQDPIATRGLIARGLAIGWVPGLLVDDFAGVAIHPIDGLSRQRDMYALLPPGDRHPLAGQIISALISAASAFQNPNGRESLMAPERRDEASQWPRV
jgi:DNA-binding transcriptional LysR family regulator